MSNKAVLVNSDNLGHEMIKMQPAHATEPKEWGAGLSPSCCVLCTAYGYQNIDTPILF